MRILRTAVFLLAMSAFASASRAAPLADPEIGYHWPTEVLFASPPPRAKPTPGSACEIANQYVTFIGTDRAPEVPKLFAQDADFIGVENRVLHGRPAIAGFYNTVHQAGAVPLSLIDRGNECIMELAGRRPNPEKGKPDIYPLVAIDHFTLNQHREIKRLVIFFRTNALSAPPAATH